MADKKGKIKIIFASDIYRGIGKKGDLLFRLSKDMKHFRETTKGQVILMGKNTMKSLGGKKLPGRLNLVWDTREESVLTLEDRKAGFVSCSEDLLDNILAAGFDVFIIGGAYLYDLFWERADEIIETEVYYHFEDADRFVPEINTDKYGYFEIDRWESEDFDQISKQNVSFSVTTWQKKEALKF